MNTNGVFESKTNNLSGITGINNNANFAIRIMAEFESTAIGSTNTNYVTTSTSGFGGAGTVRYDMMTIYAQTIPATNVPPPTLGTATISSNQIQFSVTGVTGLNYIVWASSNLVSWTPIKTNTSPFTFAESNNLPRRFYRAQYAP
jgi:hypothetical protein